MVGVLITIVFFVIIITILFVVDSNNKQNKSFTEYENEPNDICLLRRYLNNNRDIVEHIIEVQNKFPNEKIIDTINAHYLLFRCLYNDIWECDGIKKIGDGAISYEQSWNQMHADNNKLYIFDATNHYIYNIYFLIKKIVAFNDIPQPIEAFKCVQIYDKVISITYGEYCRFEEKRTIYTNGKYKSLYIYNPLL